jgi:putative ABC transport system permease protein
MPPVLLALREIRRAKVRFGLLAAAIGLLLFLVLFQQALQDGLIASFVGAVRNQSAPVLAFRVDGQRALQGSIVDPGLERSILAVEGIAEHGRIGQGAFTIRTAGGDEDAFVIGTSGPLGQPVALSAGRRPAAPFEVLGSASDFTLGQSVELAAARDPIEPLRVVGLAEDVQLSVSPTLFTDFATYERAVRAVNPDASAVLPSALALEPAPGTTAEALAARVNAAVPAADAVPRAVAADTAPGVDQVRRSFTLVLALYSVVIPLVTGLFFLIVTLQKAPSLVLLRAIGAGAGTLARVLVVQCLVVAAAGLAIGVALFGLLAGREVGGLILRFDAPAVAGWVALFLVLGLLGASASLRRVLRIDPLASTGGAAG